VELVNDTCTQPQSGFVCIAGRQLPHLQAINFSQVMQPGGDYAPVPEGSRLGSCCPDLQYLDATWLTGTEGQLRSLREAVPGARVDWP
jgi:hypothetical protein